MQAGEEIARGFFVAGRDASELFDELKETLDEVAFGVKGEVEQRLRVRELEIFAAILADNVIGEGCYN